MERRCCLRIGIALALAAGVGVLVTNGPAAYAEGADEWADWPMWRFDAGRTAASPHALPHDLQLHWVRALPSPRRAWPQQDDDGDKLAFDVSYEPIAHHGLLIVPSMVRDRVTAYDLHTGDERWRFYTDGPVRFAPAAGAGRIYAASDDGCLYCLDARTGGLVWKHRGGPALRRVLGNGRLVDTWPARGGPVLKDGTVYYAAGIWPSMGVFIHALDAATGAPRWTNSTSGSAFLDQPHAGGSFSGAAPQGYLVATEDRVIVPNGRSRPAGYRRDSGEFLYLNIASRRFGRGWGGQGGYAVMAKGGHFHVTGETARVADGELMLQVRTPALDGNILQPGRALELARWPLIDVAIANADGLLGAADGKLMLHAHEPMEELRESEPCGRGRTAEYHPLRELWTAELDAEVERVFIQAGQRVYASAPDGNVLAIDLPDGGGTARVSSLGTVEGRVWNMLAAGNRLVVVTEQGRIYCFGPGQRDLTRHLPDTTPAAVAGVAGDHEWADRIAALLERVDAPGGYAVLAGLGQGEALDELLRQSELDIIAIEPDGSKVEAFRRRLDEAGLYGERVSVHAGALASAALPPYLARLVVIADAGALGAGPGEAVVEKLFHSLRPYGGTAALSSPDAPGMEALAAWVRGAGLENAVLDRAAGMTLLTRAGALPGAGSWTHHNANAANTVVSRDALRGPLGLLWFGGPSNEHVLPRHGRGPIPQVVGGRLFILGPDVLNARDAYTGRLLWRRELPGIGLPYDTTSHQPGADHVGAPYASHEDSVYVVHDDVCLRLDPATGETLAEFAVASGGDENERARWGFVSIWDDLLIGGVDVQFFDRSRPGGNRSWNATSSARVVVMNRYTGEVYWSRRADSGFRHNAIAAGGGRLYLMDRLSEGALNLLERRGKVAADPELLALDIRNGDVLWRKNESLFGSWLGYSEPHDMLLQAGRPARNSRQVLEDEPFPAERLAAYCAEAGAEIWRRETEYQNAPMLHDDTVIVSGRMFDLLTGADRTRPHPLTGEARPWRFPSATNCAQIIASENLITFRRGTATWFDLAADSGVSNFGGVRAGCTPNLVPADGILSVPDYTRTCICAYQMQTSLALVHDPEVEGWSTYAGELPKAGTPLRRAGVNFGAPGDRRCPQGTLWLAYPEIGALGGESAAAPLFSGGRHGTSPDILPVTVEPEHPGWVRFQQHSALNSNGDRAWVFASGISGADDIRLALLPEGSNSESRYTVRLLFAEPDAVEPGQRRFNLSLQGEPVLENFDIAAEAPAPNGGVTRTFTGIRVTGELHIGLAAADGAALPPLVNGVETIAED